MPEIIPSLPAAVTAVAPNPVGAAGTVGAGTYEFTVTVVLALASDVAVAFTRTSYVPASRPVTVGPVIAVQFESPCLRYSCPATVPEIIPSLPAAVTAVTTNPVGAEGTVGTVGVGVGDGDGDGHKNYLNRLHSYYLALLL